MKISEARQRYGAQLQSYREQKALLSKQRQELEEKMNASEEGRQTFAKEAAVLDLTIKAVNEKQTEYQNYMNQLTEQWALTANMVSAKQQGDAMEEYVEDLGKIMEVARRIMRGDVVPAKDEKKLMEYSMELYQSAKSMGALAREEERKKHKSLWEDEEEKETPEDPAEVADNATAPGGGPAIVSVADTMASVDIESAASGNLPEGL
ncbi:MAG: hypothetical protein IJC59_01705 [Lachnospiraceae bacterium]|nr:hypothetical protein [Lachnospiraceae bacterium]